MKQPGFRFLITLSILLVPIVTHADSVAILNGRVMDPETGLDAQRHVLIENGQITLISEKPLSADNVIDASGMVVAPGFIDLHAHGQDNVSNQFQAADGVTTALELEIGTWPVSRYYAQRKGKALLNFGSTVSHVVSRHAAVEGHEDISTDFTSYFQQAFGTPSARRSLSDNEATYTLELLREGMRDGALGFGFGITYTPGASHEEIFRAFNAAAELDAPVFVHMRAPASMGGDPLAPVQEVIANAFATQAALHIVHINSSTGKSAKTALAMIRAANSAGLDITTESYPYTAGSTLIESALFDDWQSDYSLLQWAETGERLTEETFQKYRKAGGPVIIHGRSEETNAWLVAQPDVMVASDGISFANGPAHPRGAGTFSKILGEYVREKGVIEIMPALAKMTIQPARRLEAIAPDMQNKGRIQVGADADITIFNPDTIIDNATYTDSMQFSSGIEHVLVNGVSVIKNGELIKDIYPGRPVYGRLKN